MEVEFRKQVTAFRNIAGHGAAKSGDCVTRNFDDISCKINVTIVAVLEHVDLWIFGEIGVLYSDALKLEDTR